MGPVRIACALGAILSLSGCVSGTLVGVGAHFYCNALTEPAKVVTRNRLTGGTQVLYCGEDDVQVYSPTEED